MALLNANLLGIELLDCFASLCRDAMSLLLPMHQLKVPGRGSGDHVRGLETTGAPPRLTPTSLPGTVMHKLRPRAKERKDAQRF